MKNKLLPILPMCVVGIVISTGIGNAALLDTFDDSSSADNWTVQTGSLNFTGGTVTTASEETLATFDGLSASSVTADVDITGLSDYPTVALVLGFADMNNYRTTFIQDNGGDGKFDTVFYYDESGSGPDPGWVFSDTTRSVVRFTVSLSGNELTSSVDYDRDGSVDDSNTITIDTDGLGTGAGIHFNYGYETKVDNFSASSIPEPTTMALLGLGALLFFGRRNYWSWGLRQCR